MGNITKTLKSGAEIEIQISSFEKSHRLLQAVKASKLSMETDIIDLIVCPAVQPILWDCMAVCTYNGAKINHDTFENESAREDYLIIAKEVLVQNLSPFFGNPASKS